MNKFESDYYAKIVKHVVAPLWARKEKNDYLKYLDQLEESQYLPIEEKKRIQWSKFKNVLYHAFRQTDYYAEKIKGAGINPESIKSWDDLEKLPVLTKDDIRSHRERMMAVNIPREKMQFKKTSGSTGVSIEFYVDKDSLQWKRACAVKYDRWTGWDIGEKVGAVWGNPEYKKSWKGHLRNLLLDRYYYLDTLKMNEMEMLRFHNKIKKAKPSILFGHAHSLYLFARFMESNGLKEIYPKGIISTAMVLHDFERKKIEKVFCCQVTNRYGCEEVSLIACECKKHQGLHMNMDTLIVEIVRKDGTPADFNEPGAILVTDLTNYGMPFIRYKVGDIGILSSRKCNCGCTYPLLETVQGRIADYVVTPEGNYISGISLTENFAMLLTSVKQLQIVQEKIDYLVFRIVRGENFNHDTPNLINRLVRERFGNKIRYSLEYTHSIQLEESGKYRFCISKLPEKIF